MLQLREIYRDGYADRFVEDWRGGQYPRYIFGTNRLAGNLAGEVEVDGFINTVAALDEFRGKPVLHSLNEISEDALVIHCVVSWKANRVEPMLSRRRFRFLDVPRFAMGAGLKTDIFHFSGWAEDIRANPGKYAEVYERLSDEESRNTFHNLVNYKLSADWRYLRGFEDRQDGQYFEDFLKLPNGAVFADVGGYHGETSLEFIKRYPDYGRIHFFEPQPDNMKCAQESLKGHHDIEFIEKGCAVRKGIVGFTSDGSSSQITSGEDYLGGERIHVDRFDDMVPRRVDFIKMDIEGMPLRGWMIASESGIRRWRCACITARTISGNCQGKSWPSATTIPCICATTERGWMRQ